MTKTQIIIPTELHWKTALAKLPQANFLMSWGYGQAQEASGSLVERRLIQLPAQSLPAVAIQAIVRSARRGRYLELYGNPIVSDHRLWPAVLKLLAKLAKKHDCGFVRLQPNLELGQRPNLKDLGLTPAVLNLGTATTTILDLTASQAELLAGLRRKTRYSVRQADKRAVTVTEQTDQAGFKQLLDLVWQTARQRRFTPAPRTQLEQLYQSLAATNNLVVYCAHNSDGQLLSSALIIFWNAEADYLLGANTELGRSQPAAASLQWQAILEAKKRGCSRYNFWGVAPEGQTKHPLAGVTVFKQGFGGQRQEVQAAHDLVIKPLAYRQSWLIEQAHRLKRYLRQLIG